MYRLERISGFSGGYVLYRDAKTRIVAPLSFKLFVTVNLILTAIAITLGLLINPGFFMFFFVHPMVWVGWGMWHADMGDDFLPHMTVKSSGCITATGGSGYKYKLLELLSEISAMKEVENYFSDVDDLASEIYNVLEMYEEPRSGVNSETLKVKYEKLREIKDACDNWKADMRLAAMTSDTPLLDAAADLAARR